MTGNELLAEYDAIVANDLYPVYASTSAAKLVAINIAARRIMRMLKLKEFASALTYVTGTTKYDLLSLSPPLVECTRVVKDNVEICKLQEVDEKGWTQIGDSVQIFTDADNGDIFYIDGFLAPAPIVASGASITDIPIECQIALVLFAVVGTCVAQEEDPTQITRLNMMDKAANAQVVRYAAHSASAGFPRF